MCYECACGSTTTTMSGDSITEGTFERAAVGAGISVEEAKRNTLDLLRAELEKGDGTGTRQGPSPDARAGGA